MTGLLALACALLAATPMDAAQDHDVLVGVLPPKLYRGARRAVSPALLNEAVLASIQNAGGATKRRGSLKSPSQR